jgi:hypothetical protein
VRAFEVWGGVCKRRESSCGLSEITLFFFFFPFFFPHFLLAQPRFKVQIYFFCSFVLKLCRSPGLSSIGFHHFFSSSTLSCSTLSLSALRSLPTSQPLSPFLCCTACRSLSLFRRHRSCCPLSLLRRSLFLLLRPIMLNGFNGLCQMTHETYRAVSCSGLRPVYVNGLCLSLP